MENKNKDKDTKGIASIEELHHFRCKECDKWWSIGDPKVGGGKVFKQEWYCPWCGTKQRIKRWRKTK